MVKADLWYEKRNTAALTFLDKLFSFTPYLTYLFYPFLQAVASQIQNGSPWNRWDHRQVKNDGRT